MKRFIIGLLFCIAAEPASAFLAGQPDVRGQGAYTDQRDSRTIGNGGAGQFLMDQFWRELRSGGGGGGGRPGSGSLNPDNTNDNYRDGN